MWKIDQFTPSDRSVVGGAMADHRFVLIGPDHACMICRLSAQSIDEEEAHAIVQSLVKALND